MISTGRAWSRPRNIVLILLSAALLWLGTESAPAQEKKDNGFFFVGLNAAGGSFRGDVDGSLVLWHFEKEFFIPDLREESLLGLSFGRQWEGGAWEAAYAQASGVASLPGDRSGAFSLSWMEVRGKTLFIKRSPVHPYILIGFGFPWLRVEDGAQLGGLTQAASYVGAEIVLGAGAQVGLGSRLFFNAGVGYRYLWLLYTWGGGKGRDISQLINGQSGAQMGRPLKASSLSWEASLAVRL
jgi:hypothetical protein